MLEKIFKKIDYIFIGIVFLSLYFIGPLYQMTVKGIKVLPFDILFVILFCFVIGRELKFSTLKESIALYPKILWVSFAIFFSITLFDIFRSPNHATVVTLFLAVIRNFIFIWVFMVLILRSKLNQEQISSTIVLLTGSVSLISLVVYFVYAAFLPIIQVSQQLWHPGIWYYLSEGKFLRLSGLSSDPNFFIAVSIVGFVFSLFFFNKNLWYKIATFVIFLALIFTISKIALVLLAVLFISMIGIYFLKKQNSILEFIRSFVTVVLISVFMLFIFSLVYPRMNVFKMYTTRISNEVTFSSHKEIPDTRSSLWRGAIEIFLQQPVVGSGGKAVFFKKGFYVHNDYLEMAASYGVIGLLVLLFFLSSNLYVAYKYIHHESLLFPYLSLICYVVFMAGFSVFFNPYLFFLLGILWAYIIQLKSPTLNSSVG